MAEPFDMRVVRAREAAVIRAERAVIEAAEAYYCDPGGYRHKQLCAAVRQLREAREAANG